MRSGMGRALARVRQDQAGIAVQAIVVMGVMAAMGIAVGAVLIRTSDDLTSKAEVSSASVDSVFRQADCLREGGRWVGGTRGCVGDVIGGASPGPSFNAIHCMVSGNTSGGQGSGWDGNTLSATSKSWRWLTDAGEFNNAHALHCDNVAAKSGTLMPAKTTGVAEKAFEAWCTGFPSTSGLVGALATSDDHSCIINNA